MSTLEFNQQILSFRKPLEYFAYSLTHDEEDAKDLLQDTMMKAVAYKDKFREATNLKAWLYTIMKNTFINNYRRAIRSNTIIDTTDNLYYLNLKSDNGFSSPESRHSEHEIQKAINELPNDYRTPFVMHTTGYKYKEIAEYLSTIRFGKK